MARQSTNLACLCSRWVLYILATLIMISICSVLIYFTYYFTHIYCPAETIAEFDYDHEKFVCKEPDSDDTRQKNIQFNALKLVVGILGVFLVTVFVLIGLCCCISKCESKCEASSGADRDYLIHGDHDRSAIFKIPGKPKKVQQQFENV